MSQSFEELGVPKELADALVRSGITSPFPIQAATLPDSLAGRDVLGRGRTGSGKTIAFSLPTVAMLARSGRHTHPGSPRALILVPTRELATQVSETITPLASAVQMRTLTIFGGVGQGPQVNALRRGVDIVIATPGRLEDLIAQGLCRLDQVQVTVLDEADHMADLGFLPAVKRLLDATPRQSQRLLFSATLDNAIDQLVKRYLTDPITHSVDTAASPVPAMQHHLLTMDKSQKAAVVRELLAGQGRSLAFTRTKHGAKRLAKQLTASGIPAVDLHGNLSQSARQRNLTAFGEGSIKVLVATDIAARGIHVDDVTLVVHVDPPAEHKAFLHRSGRTARAGAEGVVVTLSTPEDHADVRTMMRKAAITPKVQPVQAGHPILEELAGPAAPLVKPEPPATQSSQGRTGQSRTPRTQQGAGRANGGRARRAPARSNDGAARPANTATGSQRNSTGSGTSNRRRRSSTTGPQAPR